MQADDLTLHIPRTFTSYGDRAFSSSGPRLWNALPAEIRLVSSLEVFKAKLKHYFFSSFPQFNLKVNQYKA